MGRVSDAKQRLMDAVLNLIWTGSYGSTTVDLICDKAGVNKGTFYYFFESKADLAVAAIEHDWHGRRSQLDELFSATVPPLERIQRFCDFAYQKQSALKRECGCVLGCPLYTLGAEICTKEQKLREKVQEILGHHRKYLESAIRDAQADHLVPMRDVPETARMVHAYYEGTMTQARIQNDAELLRELPRGIFAMLGVSPALKAAA